MSISRPTVQLSDLPDDMLVEIFARLPASDLPPFELVNRMWRRCVALAQQQVRAVRFSYCLLAPTRPPDGNGLTEGCRHFNKRLLLIQVNQVNVGRNNVDEIVKLLKRHPFVRAVDLAKVKFESFDCLVKVIEACPQLECLSVGMVAGRRTKRMLASYREYQVVEEQTFLVPIGNRQINLRWRVRLPSSDQIVDVDEDEEENEKLDVKFNDDWTRLGQRLRSQLVHLKTTRLSGEALELILNWAGEQLKLAVITCTAQDICRILTLGSLNYLNQPDLVLKVEGCRGLSPTPTIDLKPIEVDQLQRLFRMLVRLSVQDNFLSAIGCVDHVAKQFDKLKELEIAYRNPDYQVRPITASLLSVKTVNTFPVLETLKLDRCRFGNPEGEDKEEARCSYASFKRLETLEMKLVSFEEGALRNFLVAVGKKLKKLIYTQFNDKPFPEHSLAVLSKLKELVVDVNIKTTAQIRSLTKMLDALMTMPLLTTIRITSYFPNLMVTQKCIKEALVVAIAGLRWSLPEAIIEIELRFSKTQFDDDEAVGEVFDWSYLISERIQPVEIAQQNRYPKVWSIPIKLSKSQDKK